MATSPGPVDVAVSPSCRAALAGLEDLPNELLQAIAARLIPDPPPTTRFALRPAGSWEFRDAGAQWADWKTRQRDLVAFVSSSRRLRAVGYPLLFHTVAVHSGAALVRLFRQLVERPATKAWIHSLTCLVNLLDPAVIDAATREWTVQVAAGFRIPSDLVLRHVSSTVTPTRSPQPMGCIAVVLFNFIVGYADHLSDLLLAYPDQGARLGGTLLTLMRDASDTTFGSPKPVALPSSVEMHLFPTRASLQRLTSLRLYCNREVFGRDDTLTQRFAAHAVSVLPELTCLRTLEMCCDTAAIWAPLLSSSSASSSSFASVSKLGDSTLPGLRHVRLFGSRIREPELVALCTACVALETLVVHFEDSCDDFSDRPRLPDGRTLGDALLGLADSLRHLELVALSEGHYLTRGSERPRKPENHRLSCFPALYQLRRLTIDYRGLFGTLGIFEYDDGERLSGALPGSLDHFTLVCEWGTERDFRQDYLQNLDMMLDGVKLLCGTDRPRLSSICLAIHSWPESSKYRSKFRRNIEDVRSICAKAGIKFSTHELFPRYSDEDEANNAGDADGVSDDDEDLAHEGHSANVETEEELEDSEYYFSGSEGGDFERDARRPASFEAFLRELGDDHGGHDVDELYYAYYEDRWDEYLFED